MADPAADELRFLARELRRAGSRDVLKELRRGLKDAAADAANAARESILSMPSKQPAGNLRAGIAEQVKVTASLGATTVRVSITATGPERWRGAAADFDQESFNHPVYARGPRFALRPSRARKYRHLAEGARPLVKQGAWTWVKQESRRPRWFEGSISGHQDQFDRAVGEVTDRIERRLAGES